MPALDLKCITKLKAMQQRPIAAVEGHLRHIDQMGKGLDFLNLPIPQWGHLSVSDSFQSTRCLTAGFVCQRQKICSCLLKAFVPELWSWIWPTVSPP